MYMCSTSSIYAMHNAPCTVHVHVLHLSLYSPLLQGSSCMNWRKLVWSLNPLRTLRPLTPRSLLIWRYMYTELKINIIMTIMVGHTCTCNYRSYRAYLYIVASSSWLQERYPLFSFAWTWLAHAYEVLLLRCLLPCGKVGVAQSCICAHAIEFVLHDPY